jgi:hypothetical protein
MINPLELRIAQLEKDKAELLKKNRKLEFVLEEYDSIIVQKLMKSKNQKLKEYA